MTDPVSALVELQELLGLDLGQRPGTSPGSIYTTPSLRVYLVQLDERNIFADSILGQILSIFKHRFYMYG